MLLERWHDGGTGGLLFVSDGERRAERLGAILHAYDPLCGVLVLPRWDCLPYDGLLPSLDTTGRRASVLRRLAAARQPSLVLATADAALQRVPPRRIWADAVLAVRAGGRVRHDEIRRFLARTGYDMTGRVEARGDAADHGGVIDVFPPGALGPVRVDIEDGRVAALRSYDIGTQRTTGDIAEVELDPASEFIDVAAEGAGGRPTASLARRYGRLETLFDYLPGARVIADAGVAERALLWLAQVREAYDARRQIPGMAPGSADDNAGDPPARLFLEKAEWADALMARGAVILGNEPIPDEWRVPQFASAGPSRQAFRDFVAAQRRKGRRVVLAAATRRDLDRMAHQLGQGVAMDMAETWRAALGGRAAVQGLIADLEAGFVWPQHRIAVVAAADVLGTHAAHAMPFGFARRDLGAADRPMRPNDIVVHLERGIARLRGLETVGREMVRLEYAGQTTVLIPVEELRAVWRYGSAHARIRLDDAEGRSWQKRRADVEAALADVGRGLVDLIREREQQTAPKLVPPAPVYERFASRFPFTPTPDQAAAIETTLADLASGHPMNRLVSADVGYGKTEVALRAAAAAVLAGYQVVVVAPTTVLARQHLETFGRRFCGFGAAVAGLSRMTRPRDAAAVKAGLADGSVAVVIGTHAVAADDVRFARLGLVVIDEEQRFGTREKARFQALVAGVHVLTLTATPIPRTWQQAAVGLQAVSVIATPPARRLPVRTTVAACDSTVLRAALHYEFRRGGQSFVVVPRIGDLPAMEQLLRDIAPDLDVATLHGRMPAQAIDDAMLRFADGAGDVLLATNIVESGLDLPRVNTIAVWRADRFGLAQLHQLRGRVGRSSRRGYAYFFADAGGPAAERMQALAENSGLGAGFALSERDSDVRGAGDLLGRDQAGHLALVGPELYRHLLERAVAQARGTALPAENAVELRHDLPAGIPADYVGDEETRLELYARLAHAASPGELDSLTVEIDERFGPVPLEVQNLVGLYRVRQACAVLGIGRLDLGPRGAALTFDRRPKELAQPASIDRRLAWHGARLIYGKALPAGERVAAVVDLLERLFEVGQAGRRAKPANRSRARTG